MASLQTYAIQELQSFDSSNIEVVCWRKERREQIQTGGVWPRTGLGCAQQRLLEECD